MAQQQIDVGGATYDPGIGRQTGASTASTRSVLDARTTAFTDPNSPTFKGPAYELGKDASGAVTVRLSTDPTKLANQYLWEQNKASAAAPGAPATPGVPTTAQGAAILDQGTGDRALTPYANLQNANLPAFESSMTTAIAPRRAVTSNRPAGAPAQFAIDTKGLDFPAAVAPPPAPGSQAPQVDRSKVDPLVQGLTGYQNQIAGLAQDDLQLSAAEALLARNVSQAQSAALGQARSGSRRDRAALERQAVGEAAFATQQGGRDAAVLRAEEEERDRQFKLDALKSAADLGLNTAALEVDLSKTNLDSATNWINNEFEQLGINKQLDSQEAIALLGFTRDMASIEYQYDALSQDEKQFVRQQLMDKYQIDEGTASALDQIRAQGKEGRKLNWGNLLTTAIGGASSGASGAVAAKLLASDVRVKENIADPTDQEFEALMASVKPKTFDYKRPDAHGFGRNFGLMAQDLEKTPFGRSMVVEPDAEGTKRVDTGRAGLAALSGLSLVFDRVRKLEQELS